MLNSDQEKIVEQWAEAIARAKDLEEISAALAMAPMTDSKVYYEIHTKAIERMSELFPEMEEGERVRALGNSKMNFVEGNPALSSTYPEIDSDENRRRFKYRN
jgi:hypothetical protein